MAARAIWKGRIRFGEVDLPVKLYSAVQDRAVRFRLLDTRDHLPVSQRMVDPGTGKVVESDEIHRAFETAAGERVLLDDDELAAAEPEPSRDIVVSRFVPPDAVAEGWYDRPYYLGPDGHAEGYFALVEALRRREREGIARWVMRKREYRGALRVRGAHLALITLRTAAEVVPASALPAPTGRALDARELRMARQLVEAMEDTLDLSAYRDEYRERVEGLVAAKAAGKVVRFPRAPRRRPERPLADVLERSLATARKERKRA